MTKRITILAYGTRGDVQPALALGKALQAAGYRVRLLANPKLVQWIENNGRETAVSRPPIMDSAEGQTGSESGRNPLAQLRMMRQLMAKSGWEMVMGAWHACQDADVIISSFTSDTFAYSIAEKLGRPLISIALQPTFVATRNGRSLMNAPLPTRTSFVNYLFGKLILERTSWQIYGDITNRFRQEVLQLPPSSASANAATRRQTPMLLAYSQHIVPTPDDWPSHFHPTGYLFLDDGHDWQPPPTLDDFLARGPRPVCIGFSSMMSRNPAQTTQLLLRAIDQSGQRAVLLSGWAGLGGINLPETVFQLETAPHSWLYPRMAAVAHHGGAGSTAAGLRAGVPAVIVPHMIDQPFWGKRLHHLGVSPAPIPHHKLTAERLAAAIHTAVSEPTMQDKAKKLGTLIQRENGVETAVALIRQVCAT